jgi:hypothetical protein
MTIDERIQFLVQSTESLHATAHELVDGLRKQAEIQAKHDERWEALRRALRGALKGFLEDEEGGEGQ